MKMRTQNNVADKQRRGENSLFKVPGPPVSALDTIRANDASMQSSQWEEPPNAVRDGLVVAHLRDHRVRDHLQASIIDTWKASLNEVR